MATSVARPRDARPSRETRRPLKNRIGIILIACSSLLGGCRDEVVDCALSENIVDLSSDVSPIHDPTMIELGGIYYLYSSSPLGSFHTSTDMRSWRLAGEVFDEIPAWLKALIPDADHIGSPDISYDDGRYLLFYQSHRPDTCDAATGLATNRTLDPTSPDYAWVDQGLVLRSEPFVSGIDVFCGGGGAIYNAIDPHFFRDPDGTPWLVFGSTIGGIKLVQLDPRSLKPLADPKFFTLAQRFLLQEDPIIEAPYIVHRGGFYYLFLSFNHCCRGDETNYQIRVGRSREVTGPYYDKEGSALLMGGGTLLIEEDGPFIGTGHGDVFSEAGVDWLVHHAKHTKQDHRPYLNIRRIEWDDEAWPSVCRSQLAGVTRDARAP
jgi:arabinan endo-1,5-alpha-L-arabinosidase